MTLWPNVSGGYTNGLDFTNMYQPNCVYWGNNPDNVAFSALQKWFYSVNLGIPEFNMERQKRAEIPASALYQIAETHVQLTQDTSLVFLDKYLTDRVFDKASVAKFHTIWAFKGVDIKYFIILGVPNEHKAINKAS